MKNLDRVLKSKDITLLTKVHIVQAIVFPLRMWEPDNKEGREPKNWWFLTVVLEKTLESPKEIKSVNLKRNQPWILFGRTDADAEAEAPIPWLPDAKSWLTRKDPDSGKHWGQKENRATEDEMFGWHHWFNRYELGQALGDGRGQGSLTCCSPWGRKEWLSEWTTTTNK